jgi:hypothetical protein
MMGGRLYAGFGGPALEMRSISRAGKLCRSNGVGINNLALKLARESVQMVSNPLGTNQNSFYILYTLIYPIGRV